MSDGRIDPAALGALAAPLRRLVEAELATGNVITDADIGRLGAGVVFVLLARPFTESCPTLDDGVTRTELNDPHWWKSEYRHPATGHVVACRFG